MISDRTQRRFRDRLTIALESHVARLLASSATIEHHERPEYLDRLAVLRNQIFVLDHMYMSLFSTCGWILRLGVTLALAGVDSPGAGAPGRVCRADGAHVDLAAGRRASGRRARRGGQSAGAAPVRPGHDRAARQGSARDADRRPARSASAGKRGSAGTDPSPPPGCRVPFGTRWGGRSSAPAYVAAVVFVSSVLKADARRCAPRAGRGLAALGLHRRDGGRDRVSARHLARRLDTPGVARRLRRAARARQPIDRCPRAWRPESGSTTCRSPIPGTDRLVLDRCQPRISSRARWSRSWAKMARASRRW